MPRLVKMRHADKLRFCPLFLPDRGGKCLQYQSDLRDVRMWGNLFSKVDFDRELYERVVSKPAAETRYVIYFTPRSGSSWLTDILSRTKRLSLANEAFNPNFIPKIADTCNASNLDQYINVLLRRHNHRGVYGFEITMHQFEAVFPNSAYFMEHFGKGPCFWLIRQDIVGQAVSLAKMVNTQVAHTAQADTEQRQAADQAFEYNRKDIKKWLKHIIAAERKNEALFDAYSLSPLRMSYEQITSLGAARMIDIVAHHVGAKDMPDVPLESTHTKLGTSRNDEFALRFREDETTFMRDIDDERAPWIELLDDLDEVGSKTLLRP